MEVLGVALLVLQYVMQFPSVIGAVNPNNSWLQITGANTLNQTELGMSNQEIWLTRVNFLVLSFACCFTEVYFVSKSVQLANTIPKARKTTD
jgi:hypothetical protein